MDRAVPVEQVHKATAACGSDIKVYTRALKDVTASVPAIVEALQALPAEELILDGEAVVLAPDGSPQPFQVTMRRFGRKLDVDAMRAVRGAGRHRMKGDHMKPPEGMDIPFDSRRMIFGGFTSVVTREH